MATQDLSQEHPGTIDRTGRRGSVLLVLLVAAALIAAATGLTLVGQGRAETYVMVLLAVLATIGVFALLAGATGILRVGGDDTGHAMLKAVVDGAGDGIVITNAAGRAIYVNSAYRALAGTDKSNDVRSIERVFGRDAAASQAIFRLFNAARSAAQTARGSVLRACAWARHTGSGSPCNRSRGAGGVPV